MSKNLSHLAGRKNPGYNLFEELGISARETGSPDPEKMEQLRQEFLFGRANVYGTVSFYDFLKEENKGKKVYICNGSACLLAGTQPSLHQALSQYFQESEIGEMCCLGRCHENNAFHYNGQNYSGASAKNIGQLLSDVPNGTDQYHVAHLGNAVITQEDASIVTCRELVQKCVDQSPDALLETLKTSGLRGRGGAGFPIAFKLSSCRAEAEDQKFIVCNADEGDPGAYSDRYIMEQRPYLLLMGMLVSGYITGASWGILYIRAEYPESIRLVNEAIVALNENKLCGEHILDSTFTFHFKVIQAQGAYICGEETALLSSLEGQRPEVRVRPPFPTQKGLFNKPTVVNNVETLASISYIIHHGGEVYANIGIGKSTGTKLISLDGHFNRPGIYEVDMGTPLQDVFDRLGQGFRLPVKAMHIGGPLGGLVPIHKIKDLTVDFESFAQNGFLLGHASVICIPDDYPIIEYLKHLFKFTAHESCGKCFPCRLGSTRGYEMLEKATSSEYRLDRKLLDDLLQTLELGSLCALGGGLPLPIKNALMYFEEELSPYFESR